MKAVVVGYGAMGKILAEMLGNDLADVVAIECENKKLDDVKVPFDVIIDFSNPANLDMIIDYAKKNNKPVVFATTGYTDIQLERINELSKTNAVLRSANFSLGVILLNKLVKEITPILKDFDVEIVEAHHNKKIDSPSGTAKMLLNSIVNEKSKITYGREGYSPRQKDEIGVHSLRGGTVVGVHEVSYFGNDEIITLKHEANSKKIFANGAILAAKWLVNKDKGFYTMEDVLFNK